MLSSLSPKLYAKLRKLLLDSGYFDAHNKLKPIFIDKRIVAWKDSLPDIGSNETTRVEQTIYFLSRQTTKEAPQESGLVLLLDVLSDAIHPQNALHVQLKSLAKELRQVIDFTKEDDCPYRGLLAFKPEHAEVFFGRDSFIDTLVKAVKGDNPLTAVIGASGSGKSSVVMAGLVPTLQKEDGSWEVISFSPKFDPFDELAAAFIKAHYLGNSFEVSGFRDELAKLLRNNPHQLDRFITQHFVYRKVLIVVDQFEELYTRTDEKYRKSFLDLLLRIHQITSNVTLKVVLTMRIDFWQQAINYEPFALALGKDNRNAKFIKPMSEDELRLVIEKPAEKREVTFENGLVDSILQDIRGKNPKESLEQQHGQLPLLEFALFELWSKQEGHVITQDSYKAIGGVAGALNRHANKVYEALSETEKNQTRRVFLKLINSEAKNTRQVATKADLASNWTVVAQLVTGRLLVISRQDEQETVEMVHKSLIQHWDKLQNWLIEYRDFGQWRGSFQVNFKQWRNSREDSRALLRGNNLIIVQEKFEQYAADLEADEQRFIQASIAEEQRASQRRNWLIRGLTMVALIIMALAGYALYQSIQAQNAQIETQKAQIETQKAQIETQKAQIETQKAQIETQKAHVETQKTQVTILEELAIAKAVTNTNPPAKIALLLCLESFNMAHEFGLDKPLPESCLPQTLPTFFPTAITTTLLSDPKPTDFAIDPTGKYVALADSDKRVTVWDVTQQPPSQIRQLTLAEDSRLLVFDSLGQKLVIADRSNTITVWNIPRDTRQTKQIKGITQMAFDGTRLALGNQEGWLTLWNLSDDTLIEDGERHKTHKIETLIFSPDNHWLISGDNSETGQLTLWDVSTTLVQTDKLLPDYKTVAFSVDSHYVAVASKLNHNIRLYTLTNGQLSSRLDAALPTVHLDNIIELHFHPNGTWLVSYSLDGTLILWDMKNLRLIKQMQVPFKTPLQAMQFTADGKALLALDDLGSLYRWELDLSDWEHVACQQAKGFSFKEWQQNWPKGLSQRRYHLICPEFAQVENVVAAIRAGDETSYQEAMTAALDINEPRLLGYVCDFGSYQRYQAADEFCEKIVERFPKESVLGSSRALARAIFGHFDEEALRDLGQANAQFSQEGRHDCVETRSKWLPRLNELNKNEQLSEDEKKLLIHDVENEYGCGVLSQE